MNHKLYQPTSETIDHAHSTLFLSEVNRLQGTDLKDVWDLHRWSCDHVEDFWRIFYNFYQVGRHIPQDERVLIKAHKEDLADSNSSEFMFHRFFPDETLNVAEILLRKTQDDEVALVFRSEDGTREELTGRELKCKVAQLTAFLKSKDVGIGDRVVGMVANRPETVIAFLATASIGAIWSSCSPDFGIDAACDRFGQIGPKVFFGVDGYHYGGKNFDILPKIAAILEKIPSVETVVIDDFQATSASLKGQSPNGRTLYILSEIVAKKEEEPALNFVNLPFDHPLLIAFSSGTTGIPKCIVHRAGGVMLGWLKEHILHCDFKKGDKVTYFTTCGWMMWNWLIGSLGAGTKIVLYDGNPLPKSNPGILLQMVAEEGLTFFGTSARYLQSLMQMDYDAKDLDLRNLQQIASTGSPLSSDCFHYVYEKIKSDVHLASISGGTDIMGCFLLGSPTLPVFAGQIQMPAFGMDVVVYDEEGSSCANKKGELVCRTPFPNQPLGFWGDERGDRYYQAYYAAHDHVWTHGDFMTELVGKGPKDRGYMIHGRSDTTLNPSGVRIGSSEITRVIDSIKGVVESVAVGKKTGHDEQVVVFVVLEDGVNLDDSLRAEMVRLLKEKASPRHVPAAIGVVKDIPRTRSGKMSEVAIGHVLHGKAVENKESLANPESLAYFLDHPCLNDL